MKYRKRTGKLRLAFVYQVASFWPSWDSLYKSCIQDENIEVKLFKIDGSCGDKAQMDHSEDFLIKNNYPYEEFSYDCVMEFAPHFMLYQTPYDKGHRPIETWTARFKKEGIRIIYIPYGIEISDTPESRYKHFSLSVVLNSCSVFVLSDAIKKEYDKYCINSSAIRAFGLPRFDVLKEGFSLSDELVDRISGRKVILWKSHFPKVFVENGIKNQATPDLDEYLKFVRFIKQTTDLFFIFMPHPKFADNTIDHDLLPKAKKILEELSKLHNVYIDKNDDYRNSLTNADAIIVDRSAVMVESGAMGVPVLYMYNTNYNEPMTEPIQKLLDSYYQGTTADEMISFCEMVRSGEDPGENARRTAFNECVPYTDGSCAERIKSYLLESSLSEFDVDMVCELEKNSRIAVFGTGEIAKYCINHFKNRKDRSVNIVCFVDNNMSKQGSTFNDIIIISPDQLKNIEYDYVVIASDKYYRDFYLQIQNIGISKEKILNYDHFITLMCF